MEIPLWFLNVDDTKTDFLHFIQKPSYVPSYNASYASLMSSTVLSSS